MTVGAGGAVVMEAVVFSTTGMRFVEDGRSPGARVVARITRLPCEQSGMVPRIGVATCAGGRRTFEHIIDVAFGTGHARMFTRQFEA